MCSMELENPPSLTHAHQRIRLGDIQSSVQKWSTAIEYYLHAIEYFKAVQNTLQDNSLISIIQAQIIQCEKTIHLCHLKDRSEQATNAQQAARLSKMTRAQSASDLEAPRKPYRRHNPRQLENTGMLGGHDCTDSLTAFIFPKAPETKSKQPAIAAKKQKKPDSHKIEELQTGYAALQTHLKAAFDDIERLKQENNELRTQRETNIPSPRQQQIGSGSLINSHPEEDEENDDDDSETELEATI